MAAGLPAAAGAGTGVVRPARRAEGVRRGAQCTTAMADRVLLLGGEFGEGATVGLERGEDRVVSEAVGPVPSGGDRALAHAFDDELPTCGPAHHHDRAEPRRAGGGVERTSGLQLLEEQRDVVVVGRVLAGEAGRPDARRTVERLDLEAGVIGQRGQPGGLGDGTGLQTGVADQRVGILLDIGHRRWSGQQLHPDTSEDRRDLGDLVGVGAGTDQLHGISARWDAGRVRRR